MRFAHTPALRCAIFGVYSDCVLPRASMYPICPPDLIHPRRHARLIPWSCLLVLLFPPLCSVAQERACPSASVQAATPADAAYRDSDFSTAERLYADALREDPGNLKAAASLVQTLLHEDKIGEASERVQAMLALSPHTSLSLAAEAEVELRRGHPWAASQLLDEAEAADPCNARVPLTRSRVLRIDSMYSAERGQIEKAHALDPTDPDVANAFNSIDAAAQEVEGTVESLDQMKDLDAATREKAEKSVHDLLRLLSENSQTCKVLPTVPAATLPLLPSMEDGKTIDGFRLDAQLPKTSVKLAVDTAASGLYLTRALAEANGLTQGPGDPEGTVRLGTLRIGPLEFRNCLVGVSNVPFADKVEGFIGTDMFSAYLVRIDPRAERLTLSPLPNLPSVVPGDRPTLPELAGFMPVYHRRQYLLVPVTLNNKSRELFVLDTGMRSSTMTPGVAHALSNLKINFTNTFQTVSGPPIRVYRDSFDLQFANL